MIGYKPRSLLREYGEAVLIASLVALGIRVFCVQAFKIPSASMLPTLQVGDHILINKLRYGVRLPLWGGWLFRYGDPRPGEVVVFVPPQDRSRDFVKRVVAVGGEVVEIRRKEVLVNGRPRDVPSAYFSEGLDVQTRRTRRDEFGPVRVPPRRLFVMGDNRDHSDDSRSWGFVDADDVEGQAWLIYWSWDKINRWVRWERVGELIR